MKINLFVNRSSSALRKILVDENLQLANLLPDCQCAGI
jgi:hypothetical protein